MSESGRSESSSQQWDITLSTRQWKPSKSQAFSSTPREPRVEQRRIQTGMSNLSPAIFDDRSPSPLTTCPSTCAVEDRSPFTPSLMSALGPSKGSWMRICYARRIQPPDLRPLRLLRTSPPPRVIRRIRSSCPAGVDCWVSIPLSDSEDALN